jgi:hypothetical protein
MTYQPRTIGQLERMSDDDENGDMMSDGSYFQHRDRIHKAMAVDASPAAASECKNCYNPLRADGTCDYCDHCPDCDALFTTDGDCPSGH